MNNLKDNQFDSFDDSLHYYTPRIVPFLTSEMFNYISRNPSNISKFMNKEIYDEITKHANYECEPFFNNVKINIYLDKKYNQFILSEKCSASYVLVQVFDEEDHLISEEIKEL